MPVSTLPQYLEKLNGRMGFTIHNWTALSGQHLGKLSACVSFVDKDGNEPQCLSSFKLAVEN